jgi:hypothetical protein
MKYSKLKLLLTLRNVPRQGWTWKKIEDLVDSLWRTESKDIYVTGISYNSETHILTLTRNNDQPDLTHEMVGIDGEPGADGQRGTVIRAGGTIPYPFTPAWEGDYYLNQETFQLYGPIDASGLADSIYIKGDNGTDGENGTDGTDGREIELRVNSGWMEWRYVNDANWTQLYQTPTEDTSVKVSIDFVDANELQFVYNCPVAMVFTSQDSEGTDATISPALNTNLTQYQKVTITAPGVGLIVLNGNTL